MFDLTSFPKRVSELATKHSAHYFVIKVPETTEHPPFEKLFVIPNENFLKEYYGKTLATSDTVSLNLISLMGDLSHPLPFDANQDYLQKWRAEPFNRNSHLWVRVSKKLYNNSLVCFKTFDFPKHIHSEQWESGAKSLATSQYPFAWMNFMAEMDLILPQRLVDFLERLLVRLKDESAQRMAVFYHEMEPSFRFFLEQNKVNFQPQDVIKQLIILLETKPELQAVFQNELQKNTRLQGLWDKMFAFSKPEHRLGTFLHLAKHDHVFDDLPMVVNPQARHIPVAVFSVLSSAAESAALVRANCLNLFFQLQEPQFINAIKDLMPGDYKNLIELNQLLFSNFSPEILEDVAKTRGSAYTSTELLCRSIMNPNCPVILLNGSWPLMELNRCRQQLENFHLPFGEQEFGGLPQYIADALNNPNYRREVFLAHLGSSSSIVASSSGDLSSSPSLLFRPSGGSPSSAISTSTSRPSRELSPNSRSYASLLEVSGLWQSSSSSSSVSPNTSSASSSSSCEPHSS